MSYNVVALKPEHFDIIDIRDELKPELDFIKQNKNMQEIYFKGAPFFSLMKDGKVLLIYGFFNSGYGTYLPMALAAKGLDKHKFAMVRCIYNYVETYIGKDIRRFEITCTLSDNYAVNTAKFFGFETVGIRRCASVLGEDQVLLERLFRK